MPDSTCFYSISLVKQTAMRRSTVGQHLFIRSQRSNLSLNGDHQYHLRKPSVGSLCCKCFIQFLLNAFSGGILPLPSVDWAESLTPKWLVGWFQTLNKHMIKLDHHPEVGGWTWINQLKATTKYTPFKSSWPLKVELSLLAIVETGNPRVKVVFPSYDMTVSW